MLFPKSAWAGLADGSITVAFRRWKRPTVRAGGTLRVPVGVLAIDEVTAIEPEDITDDDLRRSGEPDRAHLLARLDRREGTLFRIRFRHLGVDERPALGKSIPAGAELDELISRLDAMDRNSRQGPWTQSYLTAIDRQPEVLAATLAEGLGWERLAFKRNVRRLKELGLTESCRVGYRLTPRGRAVLRYR